MTKTEVSQLFSMMMLAWPGAKMFEGGMGVLRPTVKLWALCTEDVDFWTAQQAVVRLCRESRYPPTVGAFLEQARAVEGELRGSAREAFLRLKSADELGFLEEYCRSLPPGSPDRAAVDAMGGPEGLVTVTESSARWNMAGIEQAYIAARKAAMGGPLPAAPPPQGALP